MNFFKDDTDITYGIESTIWQALEKAFEKNSKETFLVLNKFIRNVLSLSIKKGSIKHFEKYIIFFSSYYYITYVKAKENIQYRNLNKYVSELAAMQLKEILNYELRYKKADIKALNLDELRAQNLFIYKAYNGFNRLFYAIIKNGDTSTFEYALNEFNQLDTLSYNNFHDLRTKVKFYPEDTPEFENQKRLYEVVSQYQNYKRHVITGIKYWNYFMYNVDRNELATTEIFADKLIIRADSEELLKDIIFLRNKGWDGYLEWGSWDFMERLSMKSYTPPNPRDWLTLGFFIDLIRDNRYYFNPEDFDTKQLQEVTYMYETIKDYAKYFKDHFEKWTSILKVNTTEELELRTSRILSMFEQFKVKDITDKETQIANLPLSDERIGEFVGSVGKSWNQNSAIRKLFIKKENRIIDNESHIDKVGDKTFFAGAKKMFIDGDYYQPIYNVSEIGGQTARWIDDNFIDAIISNNPAYATGETILQTINSCLAKLEENGSKANLIIVPSEYSYKDESFLNDKDFIRKYDLEGFEAANEEMFLLGEFKDIPVYSCFSEQLQSKVVVTEFEKAFLMKYKQNVDWYNDELKVEVKLITPEEAKQIYDQNPESWKRRSGLQNLSEQNALVNIQNAVYLDIASFCSFEVIDKAAYVIGVIGNQIDN